MKVALVQHDIAWEDAAATRESLAPQVAAAAGAGARLVVLTEMFATGFSMHPDRIGEVPGGPTERWLAEQAAGHRIWIVGSIAQLPDGPGERAVNVAVLAAPDGRRFRYEKMHPFTYASEHEHYRAGDKPLVVDIDGLRTAIFVCYDLRFADDFWALADEVDCYVVVANWPAARREHWRILLRARAVENQAYVLGANRVGGAGADSRLDHAGDSAVVDPAGTVLVEARGDPTTLFAEVDPQRVREVRRAMPFLADRRGR